MSNLDFEALKGELDRSSQKKTGASDYLKNFVRLPQSNGYVIVRLLPPAKPGMHNREKSPFYVATRTHRLNDRSYHCLNELVGKKWMGECPVCAYCRHLWQESEKSPEDIKKKKQDLYRQIKAIERFYFAAISRHQINPETNQSEKNVGPLILSVGQTVKDKIFMGILGNETLGKKPLGDVTDLLNGRDYKIVKVMTQGATGTYPTYNESQFEDPSPLGDPDQVEKWLSEIPDLVALRRLLSPDDLKRQLKIHLGVITDDATNFDASEYEPSGGTDEAVVVSDVPFDTTPASTPVSEVVAAVAEATGNTANDSATATMNQSQTESDFFGSLKKLREKK